VKRADREYLESVLDLEVQTAQELNDMYVHFRENTGLASENDYYEDLLQAYAGWRAATTLVEREVSAIIAARLSADANGSPWDF